MLLILLFRTIHCFQTVPSHVSPYPQMGGEFINSYTNKYMKCPCGIAVHCSDIYVTDAGAHSVFQFKIESDLRLATKIGTRGAANREFNKPTYLTISAKGNVYVADHYINRIQIIDSYLPKIHTKLNRAVNSKASRYQINS